MADWAKCSLPPKRNTYWTCLQAGTWLSVLARPGHWWTNYLLATGDIVVATETIEHDSRSKFGEPLLPRFESAEKAVEELRNGPASILFRVHFGPIASGDEDVIDADRRREIRQMTGALAVAWEGAGGARACQFSGVPFIEIRGITDQADHRAASHFRENLNTAMRNAAAMITTWLARKADS